MRFIVEHGILSRGSYNTIEDARANLYDKKGRPGTLKVEMSEDEYRAVVDEINGLRDRINNITADSQRQLQNYKSQCEAELIEMASQHQNYKNQCESKLREIASKHKSEMEAINRRVEGLQNAIRKWRVKAKVDEPGERGIISADRHWTKVKGKHILRYIEHCTVPVEKNPCLAREAWAWLDEHEQTKYVERLYYNEKHGWVAAIRTEW